ncbi:hypothetical protein EVAR_58824_1 [Eumeta japonica]|uniref:Uncharacterized protein n=1 Tax=Eumeta variegata TaxID=151549 RepID=A0A4C1YH82_EUMVA|nr:hypothetical protein EVAR_58824_1 [Eumeta japonica]
MTANLKSSVGVGGRPTGGGRQQMARNEHKQESIRSKRRVSSDPNRNFINKEWKAPYSPAGSYGLFCNPFAVSIPLTVPVSSDFSYLAVNL